MHGCVLDFIHLSATGVAEIAKSTNLMECPRICVDSISINSVSLHIVNMVLQLTLYAYLFYCVLLHSYILCVSFYLVIFSITFVLITALLGLELAKKAFHCTYACDIKT